MYNLLSTAMVQYVNSAIYVEGQVIYKHFDIDDLSRFEVTKVK